MSIDTVASYLTAQTGVDFARDVWVKQPEGNYGTVSVAQDTLHWADNKPIRRAVVYDVYLFSPTAEDSLATTVETALTGLDHMRSWRLMSCEMMTDPLLMRRRWQVTVSEAVS